MSQGKLTAALLFAVVPAVFATGCVEMEEDLDVGTEAQALGGCHSWGCNSNSPVIDVWDFHDLNWYGEPNSAGVVLNGLWKGGDEYRPRVIGAKLYGYPMNPSLPVLQGVALNGAYFDVTDSGGVHWQIHINNVSSSVQYWVGAATTNETYELLYTKPGWGLRPLCKNPPSRQDGEGRLWTKQYEALLFAGDKYDAEHFRVTATDTRSAPGWFNIGCAGSALAKLHLTRHTTAGSDSTHLSGWAQRQAMLKMYVGDVCGNGFSTTLQGEPLLWHNTLNWSPLPAAVSSFEAIWNENGAVCLDEHRLKDDPLWVTLNVQAQIEGACGGPAKVPPSCNVVPGAPVVWPPGTYVVTANP
jgi:hypothetical protein